MEEIRNSHYYAIWAYKIRPNLSNLGILNLGFVLQNMGLHPFLDQKLASGVTASLSMVDGTPFLKPHELTGVITRRISVKLFLTKNQNKRIGKKNFVAK